MAIKQIDISALRVGMYITKMDVSWIDSPFMVHNVLIKNDKQVNKVIKAGVKKLSIDTVKGCDVQAEESVSVEPEPSSETPEPLSASSNHSAQDAPNENSSPIQTSVSEELSAARELKNRVVELSAQINESLKNDCAVDVAQVSPLIDGTLESLGRNNQALATLINIQRKDASLANHAFACFSLVLSLGIKLGVSDSDQEALALAAFFHDTGWLKLPLHLLGKKSAYTPSEKKLIEQHIAIGLKSLNKNCELSARVMRIITEHHEHLDGSGYPSGLGSDQIDSLSKVFAVVVRYDELVHGLNDRPAITPHGALSVLYKEVKLGYLDDKSVSALIGLLSVYPVGSAVLLSTKEKALVIETDNEHPKQPVVKVFYDKSGVAHMQPTLLNLAKQKAGAPVSIASVLDLSDPKNDPANLLEMS